MAESESGVNPLNVKKNLGVGRQGVWLGGGSLVAKHLPKKKRPREILRLPLIASSGFSPLLLSSSSFPRHVVLRLLRKS